MDKSKTLIIYFSGTGGTKRAALAFDKEFKSRQADVVTHSLDEKEFRENKATYSDLFKKIKHLVIMYSVHALDAPEPVYEFISLLPENPDFKTAVLSVSGGGEVWPNTSCRVKLIKALKKKGCNVTYENMIVMPSNWIVATNDHAAMHLLNALPVKAKQMVNDILEDTIKKSPFKISSRIFLFLPGLEKRFAYLYGKGLKYNQNCNGCKWCAQNCPVQNIVIEKGKPVFLDKCILCLRCIYGCPQQALKSTKMKFITIKEGFSLKDLEKRMKNVTLKPISECCKGFLWIGIRKYLEE